jgi:DNA-directed RNA polymerase specialized sigma24 family protein
MGDDSPDLPATQVFELEDTLVIVCSPDPEPPAPEPPGPEPPRVWDAEEARALLSMAPLIQAVLCREGVPRADVPDLVQGVVLEILAWRAERGPAPWREARAFVALVTQRAAIDHHRRRQRRREVFTSGEPGVPAVSGRGAPDLASEPSAEDAVLAAESRAELAAELALDALSAATAPPMWRAFYAYYLLNVPVETIADAERVPVPTIYNRLRLAREDLRAAVRRRRARKRR